MHPIGYSLLATPYWLSRTYIRYFVQLVMIAHRAPCSQWSRLFPFARAQEEINSIGPSRHQLQGQYNWYLISYSTYPTQSIIIQYFFLSVDPLRLYVKYLILHCTCLILDSKKLIYLIRQVSLWVSDYPFWKVCAVSSDFVFFQILANPYSKACLAALGSF